MNPILLVIVVCVPASLWAQSWTPVIDHLEIDDMHHQLIIYGAFGEHRSAVYVDSTLATCIDWQPDSITCLLPDSGRGSCGPVQVFTLKGPTTERVISYWHVNARSYFLHRYSDGGTDFYGSSVGGAWRLDLKDAIRTYHDGRVFTRTVSTQNSRWSGGDKGFRGGGGLYPNFDTSYVADGWVQFDPQKRIGTIAGPEGRADFEMDERFQIRSHHSEPYPYGSDLQAVQDCIPDDSDLFAKSYQFTVPISLKAVISGVFLKSVDTSTFREDSMYLVDTLIHHETRVDSTVRITLSFTSAATISRIDGRTNVTETSEASYPNRADLRFTLEPDSATIRELTFHLFRYQALDTLEIGATYLNIPYTLYQGHLIVNPGGYTQSANSALFHHATRRYRGTDNYVYGQTLVSIKDSSVNDFVADISSGGPAFVGRIEQSALDLLGRGIIYLEQESPGSIARVFDTSGNLAAVSRVSPDRALPLYSHLCKGLYFILVGSHQYKLLVP